MINLSSGDTSILLMAFRGGYGEKEYLWVRTLSGATFEVISTPLYVYGVSPGTIVLGDHARGELTYASVVTASRGATVRMMTPGNLRASAVYNDVIFPRATAAHLELGLSAILDPRIVASHVVNGRDHLARIARFFDQWAGQGVLKQWEMADPDEGPPVEPSDANARSHVTFTPPPLSTPAP